MSNERKVFSVRLDDCFFETMTKEQILAAIVEATGNAPTAINDAFVSKIKEQNNQAALKFWVGTQAEYNALTEKVNNCLYIITDDTAKEDIENLIKDLQARLKALENSYLILNNIADELTPKTLYENFNGLGLNTMVDYPDYLDEYNVILCDFGTTEYTNHSLLLYKSAPIYAYKRLSISPDTITSFFTGSRTLPYIENSDESITITDFLCSIATIAIHSTGHMELIISLKDVDNNFSTISQTIQKDNFAFIPPLMKITGISKTVGLG